MSLNCRPDAQRDIVAVTFSFGGEGGLDADTGLSLCRYLDVFRILEGKKCHEVGVMHDESFGGALDQITFGGMGCDDVANGVGDAAFEGERDAGKGMSQGFAAFALAGFAVW